MRVADMFALPVVALWQQKSRTVLTTLGVVFGAFVLAASLAINHGVQQTIDRESRRGDVLRRIDVRPRWGGQGPAKPAQEIVVKGKMSEAKRRRIHEALVAKQEAEKPGVFLTPEMLQKLAGLEHVQVVEPEASQFGEARFEDNREGLQINSARPDEKPYPQRIVAGRFFNDPAERGAVVSEVLLYRWGIADDEAVENVLGKKIRIAIKSYVQKPGLNVYLVKPVGVPASFDEGGLLSKVREQLPGVIDQLDLTPDERELLRQAAASKSADEEDEPEEYVEEYPIVGVLREPSADEEKERRWWESLGGSKGVVLPYQTAANLFFRVRANRERGVYNATLFIDREENVKSVFEQVRKLGLTGTAALEIIERERLIWSLVFGAMTCVATVAMLVAALGIANTMLMSVLERTREIGIMKAVGAAGRHVLFIFLVEGALIGLTGGGLGLLVAWALSSPAETWVRSLVNEEMRRNLSGAIFVFPPWLLATVMLFAVIVTTLAAVYPARRAATTDPVAALRHE
ncbi:MAG TPA: ABC transporter permease [Pirellulales bacterium]|nr:ABC transporter permease [Pirellulales bacterium]